MQRCSNRRAATGATRRIVPWKQGSGLTIDPRMVARVNILQLGAHQPWAGVGMAHTNLAELQTPVTHWRQAVLNATGVACRDHWVTRAAPSTTTQ
jgi:hypothetical protein